MKNLLAIYEVLDDNSRQQLVNLIQSVSYVIFYKSKLLHTLLQELDVVSSLECSTGLPLPPSGSGGIYHRRCLQALRYLSTKYRILPSSFVIPDVKTKGRLPVAGGGFADIWRGTLGNQMVCLKVLRLVVEPDEEVREKVRRCFCNEAILWRQLKHPNILPLLGINVELFEPSFCLISPWMENKDVITFLKQNPSHSRHKVLQDIAAGIWYLHSRSPPITHGDIRGANILITDDLRCCLTDFGLALITANSQSWTATTTSSMKGAIRWMAPELFNHSDSVPAVLDHPSRDIYAFGCTIIEILTLQYPFHDHKTDYAVLTSLMSGKRPQRPQNNWCNDILWYLTTSCWKQDHSARPNAYEVYGLLLQQCSSQDNKVRPSASV
ncbi:kinase-like domain-containing protein [Rhodocollybia butyracea]|uniref:Kinase-like domain-containing protein n=1 Tax=Rhodocollybia butyracea TaxID=206335 RepID=A0A9P5U3H9_9AGAR|nr:kinase-like domain-containing protein [Rhodocollybia butyracea]